ncbi:MAG: prepilin-type N-terminal cleavage/methylation domain-containing protein [Kiritimatiellaeota bacterium]|nr:prepilin-type N-terminal cleavage/methylation domain-containing protein [Kiritimatiellota bacterium]
MKLRLPYLRPRLTCGRLRRAFTLIELMLVVFIVLLLASLALPAFLRSFRGAQLRAAVRSAVMIHRHARNLAILRQRHVAIRVDQEQNLFDVVMLPPQAGDDRQDLEDWLQETWDAAEAAPADAAPAPPADGGTSAPPAAVAAPSVEVRRSLPAGVRITGVDVDRVEADAPGPAWIFYYPSGLCEAFVLHLEDEREHAVDISSDPLTGQVTVDYSDGPTASAASPPGLRQEGPWALRPAAA